MIKSRELADPNSCLNRSKDDEWVFVSTGRDVAAPGGIREWARRRTRDQLAAQLEIARKALQEIRVRMSCAQFESVLDVLGVAMTKLSDPADALAEHDKHITAEIQRQLISERTNFQRSTRDRYLQYLQSRKLVTAGKGGMVKASGDLF